MIRDMQTLGVGSLLSCTVCMAAIFFGWTRAGNYIFGLSLFLMAASLTLSIAEIRISVRALDLQLRDIEND